MLNLLVAAMVIWTLEISFTCNVFAWKWVISRILKKKELYGPNWKKGKLLAFKTQLLFVTLSLTATELELFYGILTKLFE